MVASTGMKSSVYAMHFGDHTVALYAAIPAALVNLVVTGLATLLTGRGSETPLAETALPPLPPATLNEV